MFSGCKSHTRIVNVIRNSDRQERKVARFWRNLVTVWASWKVSGLNFSSWSFVIRVNLFHSYPSLFRYGLLLSFWCFPILVNYYFHVSFNLNAILCLVNNSKYCEWAPLRLRACLMISRVTCNRWNKRHFFSRGILHRNVDYLQCICLTA